MSDTWQRISGKEQGRRIESRVLEERIQEAVRHGHRHLQVEAMGHHGIGGRLWSAGREQVQITIIGPPGQRVGSMGFANTHIEVMGNASDDVGWLNAGAEIVVHGHVGNGTANAMAQGRILVAGNTGARCMTMTKHNPRFDPPELWVLGSVGDYFAEFMAGGIAVICGYQPQNPENILGYRPCVGMVGGKIFFRGPHQGYSRPDAVLEAVSDQDWNWLTAGLQLFVQRIEQEDLYSELARREQWQCLRARTPEEKRGLPRPGMGSFRTTVWDRELGQGGLIGDISRDDRSTIPVITTGDLRRYVPVWENRVFAAPCEASCPTGIPVQERWRLVREGRVDEAVDLALSYTPFPATVCGYLCPNLCMQSCTRAGQQIPAVDVAQLGRASLEAKAPQLPPLSGARVAVLGAGPAGLSVAWQLRLLGHEPVVFDRGGSLGGKISQVIPGSRIPHKVLYHELERIREVLPSIHLQHPLSKDQVDRLREEYDALVVAVGAHEPRVLPLPGKEHLVSALEFLRRAQEDTASPGKQVVIIGAGNVGCDAATEAARLGAEEVTLLDIQEPASFGEERRAAEAAGATFRWPVHVKEVRADGIELTDGEFLPADTVIVSVGDQLETGFLPDSADLEHGFVRVDATYQTADPKVFAVGDAVRPGLITDAIGAGRTVARTLDARFRSGTKDPEDVDRPMIDRSRITLEYFDPRRTSLSGVEECAGECASCGTCRDCGICIAICPQAAITRHGFEDGDFELVVDPERCIGCGFCAAACPCGIWNLVENEPL
ncbi:FAD-dependent oxidoreductase [Desulfovermiculus halophilus]|uniref:FAD-dependent oxidoreductase n=1 Tax=Desulfovermiculus halophilus TaxID=339722 RepID=UPI00048503D7|nr:FAD-dependent oxidoreductase [Desulfovermiculus halophilus]